MSPLLAWVLLSSAGGLTIRARDLRKLWAIYQRALKENSKFEGFEMSEVRAKGTADLSFFLFIAGSSSSVSQFVQKCQQALSRPVPESLLRRLFMKMDANSNGTVAWDELIDFMSNEDQGIDNMETQVISVFPSAAIVLLPVMLFHVVTSVPWLQFST